MKKLFIILTIIQMINTFCLSVSADTVLESDNDELIITMPDIGVTIPHLSTDKVEQIEMLADKMTELIASTAVIEQSDVSRGEKAILHEFASDSYHSLQNRIQELGALKLTDEQALMYILGLDTEQLKALYPDSTQSISNRATVPGINYPDVSGIEFYVYEYKITFSDLGTHEMARCMAFPEEGVSSKMVKSYDWVDMYNTITIRDLVDKTIQITVEEVSDYLLSAATNDIVSFSIGALWDLAGDIYPASTSTNEASLDLKVTSSSRINHYWHKRNGTYYFKLATSAAVIKESWLLVDNNGNHDYKYHEFWSYSQYHRGEGDRRAITVNTSESYGIYIPYKVEAKRLGIEYMATKLEVSPYHAALPIHFAS